jgi:hypothetical protein
VDEVPEVASMAGAKAKYGRSGMELNRGPSASVDVWAEHASEIV